MGVCLAFQVGVIWDIVVVRVDGSNSGLANRGA